jgi:hypothetical protein
MIRPAGPISCTACTFDDEPSNGYVCTLAGYDHFRRPQCSEKVSKPLDSPGSAASEE